VEIGVFGAGAVGLGLASALLESGCELQIVARGGTAAALRRVGLQRTGIFGDRLHGPGSFRVVEEARDLDDRPEAILVATKSFDSLAAAESLSKAPAAENAKIVLCQNGWGNELPFADRFPAERIWNARVITGFRKRTPHHVEITVHAEALRIGSLFGEPGELVAPLCRRLDLGGLPCEPTDTIARDLWAKLLYNGLLNPLGALLGVSYGELGANAGVRETMRALAGEIFAVMEAAGYETHWPDAGSYLEDFYERLLPPTARHESSTLQDLRAGKRTEIDALTGAVVRLGEEHGVPVPVNRTLLAQVRFIEAQRRREG
jgi:2-dehydropantoate 2-reductase